MFMAKLTNTSTGVSVCNLYADNEISTTFYADTFSPLIDYTILDFKISGKTYAERKNAARQLAIDYQYMDDCGGLSMMELSRINNYFETIGARYGLITEYRENAII